MDRQCNTCDFLPGGNATHASFSPGEVQQVRMSPQEKSTHIAGVSGQASELNTKDMYDPLQ